VIIFKKKKEKKGVEEMEEMEEGAAETDTASHTRTHTSTHTATDTVADAYTRARPSAHTRARTADGREKERGGDGDEEGFVMPLFFLNSPVVRVQCVVCCVSLVLFRLCQGCFSFPGLFVSASHGV
jgi:hypothetical protein